jgi:hypothetical protein
MKIGKNLLRTKLSYLMVVVMLFSQSATLWASMTAPAPSHQRMQADCHNKISSASSKQNHGQQDCCKQAKHCAHACMSICMTVGLSMLPTTMRNVLPHFFIKSTNQFSMLSPDGTETTVLDRPPRQTI